MYQDKIHENYLDINKLGHSFRQEIPLQHIADSIYDLTKNVIDNVYFQYWTASSKPEMHHYGTGGLIQHTKEVIEIALSITNTLNLDIDVAGEKIFLAALYHDFGKIYEYKAVLSELSYYGDTIIEVSNNSTNKTVKKYLSKELDELDYSGVVWRETQQIEKFLLDFLKIFVII